MDAKKEQKKYLSFWLIFGFVILVLIIGVIIYFVLVSFFIFTEMEKIEKPLETCKFFSYPISNSVELACYNLTITPRSIELSVANYFNSEIRNVVIHTNECGSSQPVSSIASSDSASFKLYCNTTLLFGEQIGLAITYYRDAFDDKRDGLIDIGPKSYYT